MEVRSLSRDCELGDGGNIIIGIRNKVEDGGGVCVVWVPYRRD